ncbi:hypothetical protein PRIC1_005902 [Phytophthora ramorum]
MEEGDAFGWQLFHDQQRNLVYYLHNYTGEVRWPRPETVGFVMHGLKPLPAHVGVEARSDAAVVNPDIWSPYYPHVVMLPSGLMQVHPGPGSETQGATEMWCGYNRFPLASFGGNVGNGVHVRQYQTSEHGKSAFMSSGPRVLPPTWEESRSGSPFLPPYPVTILGHDDAEDKGQAPRFPLQRLDEHFHTPEISSPRRYKQLQSGELGRVQNSMEWSTTPSGSSTSSTNIPAPDRKQAAYPKAPNTEKKEHNRKGYLLRQARKMLKDGSSSSAAVIAAPKQRKTQEVPAAPKTTLDFSESKQDTFPTCGDFEPISPLHC